MSDLPEKNLGQRNDQEEAESNKSKSAEETKTCGPGCNCNCGTASSGKKVNTVVCLIVLLAVAGIFIYKANTRKNNPSNQAAGNSPAFAVATAAEATPATAVTSVKAETTTVAAVAESKTIAKKSDESSRKIGENLDSLNALNKVALNQDTVLIFIPAPKNEIADEATGKAIDAAQQALKAKNINMGLYTLPAGSADYAAIAARIQLPAILIASKGKGTAVVSGEVTETKLLQAYMASTRSGGCGPASGSCGPSSAGCN